jgi:hypothetical protein
MAFINTPVNIVNVVVAAIAIANSPLATAACPFPCPAGGLSAAAVSVCPPPPPSYSGALKKASLRYYNAITFFGHHTKFQQGFRFLKPLTFSKQKKCHKNNPVYNMGMHNFPKIPCFLKGL